MDLSNQSFVTSFILMDFYEWEHLSCLYFIVFLLLYSSIILLSFTLIVTVYIERSLHEPMYFFICNLMFNGVYGSTTLMPHLLRQLVSVSHDISVAHCITQIFGMHTYGIVEFSILAVMGYDRYVAICLPLQYCNIMTPKKTCAAIALSWLYPFIAFALYLILTIRLKFCSRLLYKTHCTNFSVVVLSCNDISIHSLIGLATIAVFMVPQMLMILFSYAHILRICVHLRQESREKALRTCMPHILAIINYSVGCFFEIIQSRYDMRKQSIEMRTFMSLYFLVFPPVLNPLIYGISIRAIRVRIETLFRRKRVTTTTHGH